MNGMTGVEQNVSRPDSVSLPFLDLSLLGISSNTSGNDGGAGNSNINATSHHGISHFQTNSHIGNNSSNTTTGGNTTSSEEPKDSLSSLESVETASASSWKRGEIPHLISNYSTPSSSTLTTNVSSTSPQSTVTTSSPHSTLTPLSISPRSHGGYHESEEVPTSSKFKHNELNTQNKNLDPAQLL